LFATTDRHFCYYYIIITAFVFCKMSDEASPEAPQPSPPTLLAAGPGTALTTRTPQSVPPPHRARRSVSETAITPLRGISQHTEDSLNEEEDPLSAVYETDDSDFDLPPFRIHATRVPDRLSASFSNLSNHGSLPGHHAHHHSFAMGSTSSAARRRSLSDQLAGTPPLNSSASLGSGSAVGNNTNTTRSRSKSPSWKPDKQTLDHKLSSSFSSLEDLGYPMDSDILTDRMGFVELEANQNPLSKEALHASMSSLPPVSERMCEDTLEDVHAFSDITSMTRTSVTSGSSLSRGNSVATGEVGSFVLEPLDEECEYEEELDDVSDDEKQQEVILTNLENLTIHETVDGDEEYDDDDDNEAERQLTSQPSI
jgi:hypothetical protein